MNQREWRMGLGIALLLFGLSACSRGGSGGGGFGGFPPMPVTVAEVRPQGIADRFTAIGSLGAELEVTVVSEIDAKILKVPFVEGAEIRQGALMVQLDDSQLRAELARARALVDRYRSTYVRIERVVAQGAGAPQDLDDAAADLKVAEADLALVQARLDKTQIRAPFTGIAGARQVSPGAYVRAGETITQLAQVDRLRVNFSAPERYLGQIRRGARVGVQTTAYADLLLEGSIDVIEPVLESGSRSARIVARVENPGQKLRPGMSANVSVVLGERPRALTLPNEAIFFEGQQAFVYTIEADSTVQLAAVQLGTRLSDVVEIVGGLSSGQRVVRAGHQKLFPGARVNPMAGSPETSPVPDSPTGESDEEAST